MICQAAERSIYKAAAEPFCSDQNQESSQEDLEVAVAAHIMKMENQATSESTADTLEGIGLTPVSVAKRTRSNQQGDNPENEVIVLDDLTEPSCVEESTSEGAMNVEDP